MKEKHLIIIRGLPGAGKTTLAKILSEEGKYPMLSVDDYFTNPETSKYEFEFSKNHIAYKQCILSCEEAMKKNIKKIFIHNVFSMAWEMEPYFLLAEQYQYILHVTTVEKYHTNQNTHAISDEQIKKMAEKFKIKLL